MTEKEQKITVLSIMAVSIAMVVIAALWTHEPKQKDMRPALDSLDAEVDSLRHSRETDRLRHQAQMDSLGCLIGSMEDRRKEGERRLRSLIQSPEDWFNSLPKEGRAAINGKLNSKIAETL
jgi:hypothetical protein